MFINESCLGAFGPSARSGWTSPQMPSCGQILHQSVLEGDIYSGPLVCQQDDYIVVSAVWISCVMSGGNMCLLMSEWCYTIIYRKSNSFECKLSKENAFSGCCSPDTDNNGCLLIRLRFNRMINRIKMCGAYIPYRCVRIYYHNFR